MDRAVRAGNRTETRTLERIHQSCSIQVSTFLFEYFLYFKNQSSMKIQGLYIHPSLDFVPLLPPAIHLPRKHHCVQNRGKDEFGGGGKQKQRKLDDAQERHWELNNGLGSSALSSASSAS